MSAKTSNKASARAIIVEPSRSISQLLSKYCTAKGATVDIQTGMEKALASVQMQDKVSVITISGQLDDGDGIALIYSLRAISQIATTPILFLTSDDNVETARTALVAGATEVFHKTETDLIEQALDAAITEIAMAPALAGRALVVEDTKTIARLLKAVCEELGLQADVVTSAEQGLLVFQQHDYQIAIIDIILAGLHSGIDLVRRIRRLPDSRARLPILVTSSYNDAARRIELLRSGADDFVGKPLIKEEIAWRIRSLLQRHAWDSTEVAANIPTDAATGHDALALKIRQHYRLSLREAEIALAIVQGLSDKRIAARLGISFWTVRTHINRIFAKSGSFNRSDLAIRVSDLGANASHNTALRLFPV